MKQQERHGACEKVAENILEDLFVEVLDWHRSEINNQVSYADIVLTKLGIKYLLIEAKRPGSLAWNERAVHKALEQAVGYAHEQKVKTVAVSDGIMLYAADLASGGLNDRLYVDLRLPTPPEDLWWLSVHGIYRARSEAEALPLGLSKDVQNELVSEESNGLVHPKYQRPAHCFAYVANPKKTSTWKLPYLEADGTVDLKRLPKAVQCILSNYRGAKVDTVPEEAIPDVLVRLARAAVFAGKMPRQGANSAEVYQHLEAALDQIGRLNEVYAISD